MEENKVDILVATYNSEINYLKKQIDSLINQTYSNIKIYISDDAFNNINVKELLIEYEKKDNRIKLFLQEKNLGLNSNFEFLLKQSTSKYIVFCDQDDIWHEDKIEKMVEKIQNENVDLLYSDARQIDENDVVLHNSYLKYKKLPIIKGKNKSILFARHTILGCTQMITKDVKEKMVNFKSQVIAHDWLSVVIANEGKGISYIDEKLIDYRLHTNNVFGGRDLNKNITNWKKSNGSKYNNYLNYRENVINNAYENGAKMSLEYSQNEENKQIILKQIQYFEKLKKHKYIYLNISGYFKYLYAKGLGTRIIKELVLFNFPILGFLKFKN